jgi:hypothetical protein
MKQLLMILLSIPFLTVDAQQSPVYSLTGLEPGTQTDVLFNRKKLNPAIFDDTAFISATFLRKEIWLGPVYSPSGQAFSLECNPTGIKSGIGLMAEFFSFKNKVLKKRSCELFYKYRIIDRKELKVNLGAGLGYLLYRADFSLPDDVFFKAGTSRAESMLANIGGQIAFKNHNLGIAYNDYLPDTELKDQEGNKQHDELARFTVNYSYFFQLNHALRLNPELVYMRTMHEDLFLINTVMNIKSNIRTGFYIDSGKHLGLLFSCKFFKLFELGYTINTDTAAGQNFTGYHVIHVEININNEKFTR